MVNIPRITEEGKGTTPRVPGGVITAGIVVLACTLSFGLGFISGKEAGGGDVVVESIPLTGAGPSETGDTLTEAPKAQISSKKITEQTAPQAAAPAMAAGGQYVASKSGTKYHLPWCPGAKQMKEENKIWFNSKAEAEAAGYTPAANCKGI